MIQQNEKVYEYDAEFNELRMNVLLLSYNRPRMLRDAINSVIYQDYANLMLWILDDGSDFNVNEVFQEYSNAPIDIAFMQRDSMEPDDRASRSRVAENINSTLNQIPGGQLVTYLCDDDMMAPLWTRRAAMALYANPEYHIANGEVYWFSDGSNWRTESQYGLPGFDNSKTAWYSTGSIVHRSECYWDENLKWYDNEFGHSQDVWFMNDLFALHPHQLVLSIPANIHREHDGMLSSKLGRKDDKGIYIDGFSPGKLSPDMVSGLMEDDNGTN